MSSIGKQEFIGSQCKLTGAIDFHLRRCLILGILFILLSGCAMFGISADNPALRKAESRVSQSLDKARRLNVGQLYDRELRKFEERFRSLQSRRKENPTRNLINQFNRLNNDILNLVIRTLEDRLSRRRSRISELESTVSNLRSQAQSLRSNNSTIKSKLNRTEKRLRSIREALKSKKEQLRQISDQVGTFSERQEKLIKRVKKLKQSKNRVERRLGELKSETKRLRKKLRKKQSRLRKLRQQNQKITDNLNRDLNKGNVRQSERKVRIVIGAKILFGLGKVSLRNQARSTLRRIAKTLRNYPEREIRVEGHTDDLPLQNQLKEKYKSNWELSAKRAVVVLKYLIRKQGISEDRIGAVAFGKTRPIVPNTSPSNRARNRRVEIVLLPPDLPTITEDIS